MTNSSLVPGVGRSLFIGCLVVGVVALTLGVMASRSLGSEFSVFFTGRPTDRALWLLIGGGITTAGGLIGLARGSR